MFRRVATLALYGMALSVNVAEAGMIGSTVNVSAYYPDTSSVYTDGDNAMVSGAIEYPSGSFASYNLSWEVDVTNTQIILTNAGNSVGFPFASAPFNGFIMTVISGPTLLSAIADPTSDFLPTAITVVGGNQLQLNYQGVNAGNFAVLSSIINISTAGVPEPGTIALLVAGLLGVACTRRTKSRNSDSQAFVVS
jgi:hypothetical protein